jgi:hypothetical protein
MFMKQYVREVIENERLDHLLAQEALEDEEAQYQLGSIHAYAWSEKNRCLMQAERQATRVGPGYTADSTIEWVMRMTLEMEQLLLEQELEMGYNFPGYRD